MHTRRWFYFNLVLGDKCIFVVLICGHKLYF
jgi:hypothetical protein